MNKRGPRPVLIKLPQRLLDRYQLGALTLAELASQIGISVTATYRELRRRGIDTSRGRRTRRRQRRLARKLAALYRQGLSLRQVAERTGLSPEGVRQILRRFRVRLRAQRLRYPLRGPGGQPLRLTGFGPRLRARRRAAGLSQAGLAARAGLHPLTIASLESGRQMPRWQSLIKLARALGVSLMVFGVRDCSPC